MSEDVADRADSLYERELRRRETADLRPACRRLLKRLRQVDEREYDEAVRRYREELLPAVAGGDEDPVEAWNRYGVRLAHRVTPGRLLAVDSTGRAHWLSEGGDAGSRDTGASPGRAARKAGSVGGEGRAGDGDPPADAMLLHFPEDRKRKAILLSTPEELSEHQAAARELLCE